jgi:hypothetical protein
MAQSPGIATEIRTGAEEDILAGLIGDHPCDYEECDAVATHLGLCPICSAFEYFCSTHVEILRNSPLSATGSFTNSCGHHVRNRDIVFVPIH